MASHGNTDDFLGLRKCRRALEQVNMLRNLSICLGRPFCEHPLVYLERSLQRRSPGTRRTLLRALRWVAYSLRPLEVHELLAAVSTNTELDRPTASAEAINTEPCIRTEEDLLS